MRPPHVKLWDFTVGVHRIWHADRIASVKGRQDHTRWPRPYNITSRCHPSYHPSNTVHFQCYRDCYTRSRLVVPSCRVFRSPRANCNMYKIAPSPNFVLSTPRYANKFRWTGLSKEDAGNRIFHLDSGGLGRRKIRILLGRVYDFLCPD